MISSLLAERCGKEGQRLAAPIAPLVFAPYLNDELLAVLRGELREGVIVTRHLLAALPKHWQEELSAGWLHQGEP